MGLLYFYNEIEDTEGLDPEQPRVGEDVTGWNRRSGPSNKDMTNEIETTAEKRATQIPSNSSQCGVGCALWCAHEKNVRLRAYKLVWCLLSVALTAVASGWVRNSDSASL